MLEGVAALREEAQPRDLNQCLSAVSKLRKSASGTDYQRRLQDLEEEVEAVSSRGNRAGTFEWIDSLLVKAMKAGHWLLLDDVNLCNPSVLDRLNAFLEPNGETIALLSLVACGWLVCKSVLLLCLVSILFQRL